MQIDAVLEWIGRTPNSALRVIVQGAKALDAVIVATVQSGKPKQSHQNAMKTYAKQFDRFGSGMGALAGLGTLGYFVLSKQKREMLQKAIQRANFPR